MELSKEQQILRMIRKTLGAIARETAPQGGEEHPLTEQTFQDMRNCFGLITELEKELSEQAGVKSSMRPGFSDQPSSAQVVTLDGAKRS
jgi:folate-dependent tRNA-U54 methylase TrmFO/GidA